MVLTVEVGGSSTQAVLVDSQLGGSEVSLEHYRDEPWLLAAPGLVQGNRVRGAHHLGWMDVQANQELGMANPPSLGMNDAEAAALGEWVLRGGPTDTILYISMGTGIGAVAVRRGDLIPVEFGHLTSFGPNRCGGCGRAGCLDAQIGGHALPTPLAPKDLNRIVDILDHAVRKQDVSLDRIVLGGGMPRRYPEIVTRLRQRLSLVIEPSASPKHLKSAAAIGLFHTWNHAGH